MEGTRDIKRKNKSITQGKHGGTQSPRRRLQNAKLSESKFINPHTDED